VSVEETSFLLDPNRVSSLDWPQRLISPGFVALSRSASTTENKEFKGKHTCPE
jgi:hypothetical protein